MTRDEEALVTNVHTAVDDSFKEYLETGELCLSDLGDIEEAINTKIKTIFNKYWEDAHTPEELAAIREDQKTWIRVANPTTYSYVNRLPPGMHPAQA